ncbi:MAG: response regulator [Candidatus Omnitrophota bacterium]|nr:response regulator [Candidatus Omnitrophota bacterium]
MKDVKKILVASLDPEVTAYLLNFVPLLGSFEVALAASPMETMAKANAFEPVLLICDVSPSIQAYTDTLVQIRTSHPKLSVVGIIPEDTSPDILRAAKPDETLAKPINSSQLSKVVKALLPTVQKETKPEYARMLVADDESGVSEILADLFKPLGIEVHLAADGQEAVDTFKEKICNLAILDLTMPILKGTEVAKILEASENPPKPKFVVIVTAALGERINELKRRGYPIVPKPMDLEVLEKCVLDACEKYHLALHTPPVDQNIDG